MEEHSTVNERAIATGSILNERYEIKRTLGEGGFGITYEAVDVNNGGLVCIKEYFPAELALREHVDSSWNLHIFSGEKKSLYERGLKRFLNESEILKNFQYLDGIVTVMDSFQENKTAYIVMEYIDGITLKQYIEENGRLTYSEIIDLIKPVMRALVKLHRQGLIHRDISPDNLMIGMDNKMRLIDFGAAETTEIADEKTRTIILKSGFAPPEQYISDGKQGAWTDVYALSATIYTAITGRVPVSSVGRLQGKELIVPEKMGIQLELWQWDAIRCGMSIGISDRYRDAEALLEALTEPPALDIQKTVRGENIHSDFQSGENTRGEGKYSAWKNQLSGKRLPGEEGYIEKDNLDGHHTREENENKKRIVYISLAVAALAVIVLMLFFASSRKNANTETQSDSNQALTICTMPQVTGYSEATARDKISGADATILIKIVSEASDSVARGNVISQSVAAETQYNEGSIEEITLTVSSGKVGDVDADKSTAVAISTATESTTEAISTTTESAVTTARKATESATEASGTSNESTTETTSTSTANMTGTTNTTEVDYDFDIVGDDDYADILVE
jgi:serine/threonine protein kinase